ncbi:hypothetical protein [Streptomyces sp. NPDC014793]|uniref:hypothetical protein n=1 Tax=Streptomyces sp. NPDC014793 TaxID=3364914 RepID=UPI0036FDCAF6
MIEIVRKAAESGICDAHLIDRLDDTTEIETGNVSREDLLHIYKRRMKRTTPGSKLQSETASLISFLEQCQRNDLTMASISLKTGGSELFLMDNNEEHVLHWMSMFSR